MSVMIVHSVFDVSCQDDDTPVNSDNESNDDDDKERRKSILNQMSLPQVLKDQGMTSLPSKVSFVLPIIPNTNRPRISRMKRTQTDKAGQALTSGLPCRTT